MQRLPPPILPSPSCLREAGKLCHHVCAFEPKTPVRPGATDSQSRKILVNPPNLPRRLLYLLAVPLEGYVSGPLLLSESKEKSMQRIPVALASAKACAGSPHSAFRYRPRISTLPLPPCRSRRAAPPPPPLRRRAPDRRPLPAAQDGKTALILAAENGRFECVAALISAGADREAKEEARSLLPLAPPTVCPPLPSPPRKSVRNAAMLPPLPLRRPRPPPLLCSFGLPRMATWQQSTVIRRSCGRLTTVIIGA